MTEGKHETTAMRWRLAAPALAVAIALVYWPGLRSYPVGDDFSLLAFARILREPWALFTHEHFPLAPYFRPLTMTLWWATAQAFGNALLPQYAVNLALHVATSLALLGLLRRFVAAPCVAVVVAMLFAVHPIAIGTGLWLASRFDLLSVFFAVLALRSAVVVRQTHATSSAWLALALLALSLAAKEIGLVAAAATALIWIWPPTAARGSRRWWSGERPALLVLIVGVLAWTGWRIFAMQALPNVFPFSGAPMATLLAHGGERWAGDFLRYLAAWDSLSPTGRIALVTAATMLAAILVLGRVANAPAEPVPVNLTLLAACAVAIVALSALIQAPIAYWWPVDPTNGGDAVVTATHARLFYFPLCAVAMAAAALIDIGWRRARLRLAGPMGAILVALGVLPWAFAAHALANDYRRESNAKRPLFASAVAAATATRSKAPTCRVFLLDVAGSEDAYLLKSMSDAVVKALAPDVAEVEHCLFQSEQASWENIVGGARLTAAQALPMVPMSGNSGAVPWIDVGGLQVVFLNLKAGIDAREFPDAVFLRQRGGTFEDVSAAVRDGSLPVRFVCARSEAECRQ